MIYQKYVKRILDITLSGAAIIVLSPVMGVTAILVKKKLGSPVIFKQKRPGKDEKIFTMYKFRTMLDAKDSKGNNLTDEERLKRIALQKKEEKNISKDENRITPFGKKMRAMSLDELPELFNIFKGDMSFVGPRPLVTIYLPYYNEYEKKRHNVRPGLTGLAQVNGRNGLSWKEKFYYDTQYVENVTFIKDLKILLKTVRVVLSHNDIGQGGEKPEAFHIVRQRELNDKLQ
ncbi:sugar transferase [Eubacterium limosum]|jgi:undecaprenyl phosphate N,N'-diacetylbacillosamine 1-phosphate transferase|uniref:Sugar transferase n=1 Tax=Eubacterium limosum TaxID=1736 RepID=A0AAC9QW87_EUBLI|nr:sugar transferase [Eubacterium limosum]ARD66877.1 sugar transferase [Eubacterium limosum]PWW55089.1 lipopolysaccharide/colanic/teichoic acid biosynthesis glycosyltransferase [Eubacterium limosum]UQZ22859.1 sugar transferase [Eubacterium limosum]